MANCRSCGKQITWVKTRGGTDMPVDYLNKQGNVVAGGVFDSTTMVSHFATCPQAGAWRKKKGQ